MITRVLGLFLLWGAILFVVMQQDTVIWVISAIASIVLMHFVSKWVKLGGLAQLGLKRSKRWIRFLLIGSVIGIFYQLIRFSILIGLHIVSVDELTNQINSILLSTIILLISTAYIGFAEEIVFRGYLINILPSFFSTKFAALISAIIFALGHVVNGQFDVLRAIELIFVGFFLAYCYISTKSLWFVAGVHWFWNFTWFYLGADGGSSSSKLFITSVNQNSVLSIGQVDAVLAISVFLFAIFVNRVISKRKTRPEVKNETLKG